MKKIIFVSNLEVGTKIVSGGSRIYIELLKNWKDPVKYFFGSAGTIRHCARLGLQNIEYFETDPLDCRDLVAIRDIIFHTLRRTVKGLRAFKKNKKIIKEAGYIYSVSDFWPDFWPAFWTKRKNPKIVWLAAFYLSAPSPFAKNSPYKKLDRLRGFFYWLSQRPALWIIKKYADFVFVTSEPDVEKFVTPKRDHKKIVVVRGGVETGPSEKYLASGNILPLGERSYDACFVGRLHFQKGALELIDIWKIVTAQKKNAKLALIGIGPLEGKIREKIEKYNLAKNIDLLGFRDGEEKYEVFKNSKMILHPATYDSGGMAAAEGMAWGLPAVSFDLPALKTYYPQGMIKIPCVDLEKFAENILRLLDDPALYENTAREALDLIREKWDWKKRAGEIYNQVFND